MVVRGTETAPLLTAESGTAFHLENQEKEVYENVVLASVRVVFYPT